MTRVAHVARARVQTGSVSGRVEQLRHGHRVAPLQPPHQRVLLLEWVDFIFIFHVNSRDKVSPERINLIEKKVLFVIVLN